MKEVLFGTLGWSTVEWKRTLGVTAWALLYRQIEVLLEAHVAHIVEGNFDPKYANLHWRKLTERFDLQLIQVRCECDPLVLLERDRERIQQGKRHPGHILLDDPAFYEMVQKGPMDWIAVESERISVDTTLRSVEDYTSIAQRILELSRPNSNP
jgi:hypothetical protein